MGRLSKSVSPHFRAILAGNRSEEVVGWCRTRSPEAHLQAAARGRAGGCEDVPWTRLGRVLDVSPQDLCGGGRATPVLLSNNAEDRLFAPDAALLYRQALHGAGCRVETMIHEGIHAMAELPGMLGFSDAVATSSPLWSRVLAFLDANLKPGAAPPPPPPPALSFQLRQPEASVFKNYVPVYLDFDSWPSPRVQPSSYRLRGDALAPPQARDVAAPSPPPKAEECTRRLAYGPDTGFSGGAPLHTALGRGVAREVSRNVPPRLSPPQVPLLSPFVSAAAGVQIKSYRRAINSSSAALFVAPPQAAPLRVCGIPNATFHASSSMDRFQLAARVFSMAPNGELELLSFGARDVWHRGPDPPYLRPDDVRDNWDVPAGGAGEVVVRMAALCTDVPAGNAVALGLSLHDPTRAAANSDVALRVDVGCCGASALWLPVVGASGGAAL
uniref:Xaa-Pro dipeptidyl-peptidase C-terminal domain-containing protein n=1 Tax=Emiliania huxleyi TaxID=2903 RepID=A0A7S3SGK5_EMIHU